MPKIQLNEEQIQKRLKDAASIMKLSCYCYDILFCTSFVHIYVFCAYCALCLVNKIFSLTLLATLSLVLRNINESNVYYENSQIPSSSITHTNLLFSQKVAKILELKNMTLYELNNINRITYNQIQLTSDIYIIYCNTVFLCIPVYLYLCKFTHQ